MFSARQHRPCVDTGRCLKHPSARRIKGASHRGLGFALGMQLLPLISSLRQKAYCDLMIVSSIVY